MASISVVNDEVLRVPRIAFCARTVCGNNASFVGLK